MALATRCSEACSSCPGPQQDRAAVDARDDVDIRHRHRPGRDRPGLVEHDGVDLPRGLESLVSLEEDPESRTLSGRDEKCRGSRQTRARRDKR